MSDLVKGTVCLRVEFSRPGITRKLRKDQFQAEDADKSLVGASKRIVDAPEYRAIGSFQAAVKNRLRSESLPSSLYRDSTFLVPIGRVAVVDELLTKAQEVWQEKLDAYAAVYDVRFDETKARLGQVGSEADRMTPEQLRNAFRFSYEWVTMSTPSSLKEISAEMFKREEARLADRLKVAETEIVSAYRAHFGELVDAMVEMLNPVPVEGEKPKKFSVGRVERLKKFMAEFSKNMGGLAVEGSEDLAALMEKAHGLLDGVDPKAFAEYKDDTGWRLSMVEQFGKVKEGLATMVVAKARRAIVPIEDVA